MDHRLRIYPVFLSFFACCLLSASYNLSSVSAQQQKPSQQPVQQKPQTSAPQSAPQRSLEEDRLNILKSDIQKEINEYRKLKKELEEAQKPLEEKKQERVTRVAKMYEAMAPEDAVKKLEKLDEETVVMILNSLKPKTAGKIMAQMEDSKAASLSKKIIRNGSK